MRLGTVLCDGRTADDKACAARAVVHEVHYKYAPYARGGALDGDRVLTEIRYDIDCPACGYRTQVEKLSPTELLPLSVLNGVFSPVNQSA